MGAVEGGEKMKLIVVVAMVLCLAGCATFSALNVSTDVRVGEVRPGVIGIAVDADTGIPLPDMIQDELPVKPTLKGGLYLGLQVADGEDVRL